MQNLLCDEKWVCLIISLENEVQDICNRGVKCNGQTFFNQRMSGVKINRLLKILKFSWAPGGCTGCGRLAHL